MPRISFLFSIADGYAFIALRFGAYIRFSPKFVPLPDGAPVRVHPPPPLPSSAHQSLTVNPNHSKQGFTAGT